MGAIYSRLFGTNELTLEEKQEALKRIVVHDTAYKPIVSEASRFSFVDANQPIAWLTSIAKTHDARDHCISVGLTLMIFQLEDDQSIDFAQVAFYSGAKKFIQECDAPLLLIDLTILVWNVGLVESDNINGLKVQKATIKMSHANALVLDRSDEKQWMLIHFEPELNGKYESTAVNKKVAEILKTTFPQFEYQNPDSLCPKGVGPQLLEAQVPQLAWLPKGRVGFCEFWYDGNFEYASENSS